MIDINLGAILMKLGIKKAVAHANVEVKGWYNKPINKGKI